MFLRLNNEMMHIKQTWSPQELSKANVTTVYAVEVVRPSLIYVRLVHHVSRKDFIVDLSTLYGILWLRTVRQQKFNKTQRFVC